jgi:hypothetical protein
MGLCVHIVVHHVALRRALMPNKSDRLHRYSDQGDGRRNIGVDVGEHVTVLVSPRSADAQAEAERIAFMLLDHQTEVEQVRTTLSQCRADLDGARTRASEAEAALNAALSGKRRFFGRVLMKPATAGNWEGVVWLLDPDKQEMGLGLRFNSAADVRRAYPELWVVGMTADGVLLDASPLGVAS